jgi:hypothetical protein
MFSRRAAFPSIHRATAMALAAAFSLTVFVPSPASAGSALHGKGFTTASDGMTDISARRRGFNPGAAAAFAGVVGAGLAIAAAANSRAYYDDGYGYGYGAYAAPGPVYVSPGPYYYGGYGGYYGSSVPPDQHGHPLAGW